MLKPACCEYNLFMCEARCNCLFDDNISTSVLNTAYQNYKGLRGFKVNNLLFLRGYSKKNITRNEKNKGKGTVVTNPCR